MPLFEYHCPDCSRDFEALVSSSQTNVPSCPHCQSTKSQKQLSVIARPASSAHQELPACASGACDYGHSCAGGSCHH